MPRDVRLAVPPEADGTRLDVFLLRVLPELGTRGEVQRAIRSGAVRIPGKRVIKPSTAARGGQEIIVREFKTRNTEPGSTAAAALAPLRILHEDRELLVLDKPAGVPVHPGVKAESSLADALLARYPALKEIGEPGRGAGIVHRLDKDTSGVLLVARTPEMYAHLKAQFQTRKVRKRYLALVHGVVPEKEGVVKLPITRSKRNPLRRTIAKGGEGKGAETAFRVLERFPHHTLLEVFPRTGRMHQIRVHLSHLGFPVAGDSLYGKASRHRTPPGLARQFLHAAELTVTLPSGKPKTFSSPLPLDLDAVLRALRAAPRPRAEKPLTYRWRKPRA